MDIATISTKRKVAVTTVALATTDASVDPPLKKKLGLSEAVRKHMARKKWLKEWDQESWRGPIARCLTSVVKQTHGNKNKLWGAFIDAAIAAVPAPAAEGRQVVEVCPPYQGRSKIPKDEFTAAVEASTEDGWWFTPRTGWPKSVDYAGGRPTDLMPTAEMAEPGFYLPDSEALGELRVELLECDGLPTMDLGAWDENDIYALLVFEGTVARTRTITDVDNPRWHHECPRGFRLPVHSATSALHLAFFDSDEDAALNKLTGGLTRGLSGLKEGVDGISPGRGAAGTSRCSKVHSGDDGDDGNLMQDDPIGRLVIEPRQLVPGTTYDSWFELRRSAALDDAGQFGAVRLRLFYSHSCALAPTPYSDPESNPGANPN